MTFVTETRKVFRFLKAREQIVFHSNDSGVSAHFTHTSGTNTDEEDQLSYMGPDKTKETTYTQVRANTHVHHEHAHTRTRT